MTEKYVNELLAAEKNQMGNSHAIPCNGQEVLKIVLANEQKMREREDRFRESGTLLPRHRPQELACVFAVAVAALTLFIHDFSRLHPKHPTTLP